MKPRGSSLFLAESDSALREALQILHEGGIVAHATETCYGLACDLTNPRAVEKLFAIKERSTHQPVSALFSSLEEAKKYVCWNANAQALADQYLPGPLTLVLPQREDAPHRLFPTPSGGSTLGIRISPHPFALRLAEAFGTPISTTSANIHGFPSPYSAEDIEKQFLGRTARPQLIIDGGILPARPSSTVIDLTSESQIRRQGAVDPGN